MTIEEMNAKYGKPVTTSNSSNVFAERWGTTEVKEKKPLIEKVADFTGGKEISQGLGQALANKKISKNIDKAQDNNINIQSSILKRIDEKKKTGEDTSELENALNIITKEINQTGQNTEKLLNQNELTNKQVIGDALQLGTTIAGAGTYGKATSGMTSFAKSKALPTVAEKAIEGVGVGKGILQGAKTGAVSGGIFGASSGISGALEEDKSALDIAKSGVGGALIGAGTGGILGGVIGGVSGGIKGAKIAKQTKKDDLILDIVSPKATTAVKEQALKEGRVTPQGLLSASKILPSKRDMQLAEVIKDLPLKKDPTYNLNIIDNKVKEINSGVKAYVNANKVPFNTNQLKKQLDNGKEELNLIFASDKQAETTYNAVVKEFMKNVEKKDTAGLLDARQSFDKIPAIKKLLDSQGLGENAKKEIVLTARGQANKYISNLLPTGNEYKDAMLNESKMIEIITNLAEKNANIIGTNKLQILSKKYPLIVTALGTAATTILGLKATGVGNSIMGSSD